MDPEEKKRDKSLFSALVFSLVILFFIVYSGIVLHPRTVDMKGKIHAGPDPKTIMWAMTWDHRQLLRDPLNLYRANIYYPHKQALAFSDTELVPALTTLPFRLFINEPTVLFNLAYWIAFILSGLLMYKFVQLITGNHLIGIIAGIFFSLSPYRLDNITHLQYTSQQWLPMIVLSFVLFFLKKKKLWLIGAVAFTWLNAMSCGTYMIMAVIPFGLMVLLLWIAAPLDWKGIGALILAGVLLVLLLFPFYYPAWQAQKEAGTSIKLSEVLVFTPDIFDYVKQPKYMISPPYSILPQKVRTPYFSLFPGFLASALILAAFIIFFRKEEKSDPTDKITSTKLLKIMNVIRTGIYASAGLVVSVILFFFFFPPGGPVTDFNIASVGLWSLLIFLSAYAFLSADLFRRDMLDEGSFLLRSFVFLAFLSALLALGPYLYVNNHSVGQGIYMLLYSFAPGIRLIRQVMHFNTFFMLFAVPAAALALKRVAQLPKYLFYSLIPVLFLLIFFEYRTDMSRDYAEVPLDVPAMYRWLAAEPEASPVIELPVWQLPSHQEADRMYWSIYHWKPIVNGLFSYHPREYHQLISKTADFPSETSIRYIQDYYRLKYIIVRLRHYNEEQQQKIEELFSQPWSDYKLLKKWDYFWVFQNQKWEDRFYYAVDPPPILQENQ